MEKQAEPEQHPAGRVGRFFADLGPGLITGAADDQYVNGVLLVPSDVERV